MNTTRWSCRVIQASLHSTLHKAVPEGTVHNEYPELICIEEVEFIQ